MTRLLAAAAIAAAAVSLGAAPALAVIAKTGSGHYVSYQPTLSGAQRARRLARSAPAASAPTYRPCSSSEAACLLYEGGPVMRTTTLTPVFWNPGGLSLEYPAGYETEIDQFIEGLAAESGAEGNFFSILTQYYEESAGVKHYVAYAVTAGKPQIDANALPTGSGERCTDPYSSSRRCVTDLGVRNELKRLIAERELPAGLGQEYIVFFPSGVDSCFDEAGTECSGSAYCGYHGTITGVGGGQEIQYVNEPDNAAADPESTGSCSMEEAAKTTFTAAYATVNTTSHEISESVTDPEVGVEEEGRERLSWYDSKEVPHTGTEYGEIGDMCAWEFRQGTEAAGTSTPQGASNQTIDGRPYLLQDEWDNQHSTCSISERTAGTHAAFGDSATSRVKTGEAISFDASESHSPAAIDRYEWEWGDGTDTVSSEPTAIHIYLSTEGQPVRSFPVTLKVTDANGNTSTTTAKTVEVEDRPPVPMVQWPTGVSAGSPTSFDAVASSDPDGSIVSYAWSFGDGTTGTGATPAHTYARPGRYTATLTLTDNAGVSSSASHTIEVADTPPTASFSVKTTSPVAGEAVSFDGSASSDIDGSALTETWSFGDGTSATGVHVRHAYSKAGAYTVTLTATDSAGLTATSEQTVTVAAPPNAFRILRKRQDRRNGTVRLIVAVPWKGVVSAHVVGSAHVGGFLSGLARALEAASQLGGSARRGAAAAMDAGRRRQGHAVAAGRRRRRGPRIVVRPGRERASGPGRVTLVVSANRAGRRDLAASRSLKGKLAISFTPTDGERRTVVRRVTLLRRRR